MRLLGTWYSLSPGKRGRVAWRERRPALHLEITAARAQPLRCESPAMVDWLSETLDSDEHSREEQHSLRASDICATCAERGRPNEPVYKMEMCEFCYKGRPHPKATREQLVTERVGGRTGSRHPPPNDKACSNWLTKSSANRK